MRTLISVIAYNEALNIRAALKDLRTHNCGFDIVVIDNGSHDGTAAVCRELHLPVVSHCINTGGSMGTVTSYFNYAYDQGYDCLCQFDGDGQHLATELPAIIAPIQRGEADYVIGSRFLAREGFRVVGLEKSREAIRLAREAAARKRLDLWLVRGDALFLPFRDGKAGAVLVFYFLERAIMERLVSKERWTRGHLGLQSMFGSQLT